MRTCSEPAHNTRDQPETHLHSLDISCSRTRTAPRIPRCHPTPKIQERHCKSFIVKRSKDAPRKNTSCTHAPSNLSWSNCSLHVCAGHCTGIGKKTPRIDTSPFPLHIRTTSSPSTARCSANFCPSSKESRSSTTCAFFLWRVSPYVFLLLCLLAQGWVCRACLGKFKWHTRGSKACHGPRKTHSLSPHVSGCKALRTPSTPQTTSLCVGCSS